jgi:hypothetical protein
MFTIASATSISSHSASGEKSTGMLRSAGNQLTHPALECLQPANQGVSQPNAQAQRAVGLGNMEYQKHYQCKDWKPYPFVGDDFINFVAKVALGLLFASFYLGYYAIDKSEAGTIGLLDLGFVAHVDGRLHVGRSLRFALLCQSYVD